MSKTAQDLGQGYHTNRRAVLVLQGSVNSHVLLQTLVHTHCGLRKGTGLAVPVFYTSPDIIHTGTVAGCAPPAAARAAGLVSVLYTPVSCRYVLVKTSKALFFLRTINALSIYSFLRTIYVLFAQQTTRLLQPSMDCSAPWETMPSSRWRPRGALHGLVQALAQAAAPARQRGRPRP